MDLELVKWIFPGKNCANANALSRSPLVDANAVVAAVVTEPDSISHLLASDLGVEESTTTFAEEQRKDPDICSLLRFLEDQRLPEDPQRAKKIALQTPLFTICDNILYYIDPKPTHRKRIVVPKYLTTHRNRMAGHFSGQRVYNTLTRNWWWEGMYSDSLKFVQSCPECLIRSDHFKSSELM